MALRRHTLQGTLPDGRVVAVKQISVASNYVNRQFMAEIVTISVVQHRNLVKLYGCCIEGNRRILVYEYLENRSLDQALFGMNCSSNSTLSVSKKYNTPHSLIIISYSTYKFNSFITDFFFFKENKEDIG